MSDLMNDPTLSPLDRQWVVSFQAAVDDILAKRGFSPDLSLFTVASTIGLDVSNLHKEGTLLYALWVVILNALQKYVTPEDMKYPSIESFLEAYPGWFTNDSDYEKRYLWLSANWMNILFRMITARKNKGLVLQVVPKLIEGWDAKYVTGSGQTKATANRVHIFETEGNTKANQRGKAKAKTSKKTSSVSSKEEGSATAKPKKRKRNNHLDDDEEEEEEDFAPAPSVFSFTQPFGSVAQYRGQRNANTASNTGVVVVPPMPTSQRSSRRLQSGGSTDIESSSGNGSLNLNEDVKNTFAAWQEATENFGLGLLNLSRSNSYANGGLARNVEQQLTDPMDYQRGFSWTEIPLVPSSLSTTTSSTGYGVGSTPQSGAFLGQGQGEYGGLSAPAAVFSPPIFPPPEVDTTEPREGASSLEVGTIVPSAQILDLFQGYK
eukprot:gene25659-28991_t